MKTTRRQELRTNDLSQQIEQVRDSLKNNATTITVVVVVVAGLSFGGYWYYGQQSSRLEDAYSQLGRVSAGDDLGDRLQRFQAVAREQINPSLTVTAWSRVGDLALSLLAAPPAPVIDPADPSSTPPPPPPRDELIAAADEAFANVLAQAAAGPLARGHAMIAMGVLEEDRRQFEKARQWYEKILADDRLDGLPFQGEAEFRLAGMKTWSKSPEFPAAPPMVLLSPQAEPATLQDLISNTPAILPPATSMPTAAATTTQAATSEIQASSPPPADSPAPSTAAPTPRPTPTTQPVSGPG